MRRESKHLVATFIKACQRVERHMPKGYCLERLMTRLPRLGTEVRRLDAQVQTAISSSSPLEEFIPLLAAWTRAQLRAFRGWQSQSVSLCLLIATIATLSLTARPALADPGLNESGIRQRVTRVRQSVGAARAARSTSRREPRLIRPKRETPLVENESFRNLAGWQVHREGRGILVVDEAVAGQGGARFSCRRSLAGPCMTALSRPLAVQSGMQLRLETVVTLNDHDGEEGGLTVALYGAEGQRWRIVFRPNAEAEKDFRDDTPSSIVQAVPTGKAYRYCSPDLSALVARDELTKIVVGALGNSYDGIVHYVQLHGRPSFGATDAERGEGRGLRVHAVHTEPVSGGRGTEYLTVLTKDGSTGKAVSGARLIVDGARWLESAATPGTYIVGPLDPASQHELLLSHDDYGGGRYRFRPSPPYCLQLQLTLFAKAQQVATTTEGARVEGRVFSRATGRPIAGALLGLDGRSLGMKTDEAGRFTIARVSAETEHELVVTGFGYQPVRLPFQAQDKEVLRLVIDLQRDDGGLPPPQQPTSPKRSTPLPRNNKKRGKQSPP